MGKRNIIGLILLALYLIVVGWCCFGHFETLSEPPSTILGIPTDKIVHFIMFLPFPFLCYLTFEYMADKPWKVAMAVASIFLVGCMIAAGTEIGQSFTKHRSGDVMDFMADMAALAAASLVILVISLTHKKKTTR